MITKTILRHPTIKIVRSSSFKYFSMTIQIIHFQYYYGRGMEGICIQQHQARMLSSAMHLPRMSGAVSMLPRLYPFLANTSFFSQEVTAGFGIKPLIWSGKA